MSNYTERALSELESSHVQNNKHRMGALGAQNIDRAIAALRTASQGASAAITDEHVRVALDAHSGAMKAMADYGSADMGERWSCSMRAAIEAVAPLIAPGGSGEAVAPNDLADWFHDRLMELASWDYKKIPELREDLRALSANLKLYKSPATARAGVDLEQFRDAVQFFVAYTFPGTPSRADADRLLTLIDANKQESGNG